MHSFFRNGNLYVIIGMYSFTLDNTCNDNGDDNSNDKSNNYNWLRT